MFHHMSTLILLTLVLNLATSNKDWLKVTSPAGTLLGKTLTSQNGIKYRSFRGIPYALPPTGDQRFALPEPNPAIPEGVYDATAFGPICSQTSLGVGAGQEDCLYLNVYTPLTGQDGGDASLKKVLVLIHGGGFTGSSNIYLPGEFVTRADVIVVTMNYRLGVLGFLRGNSSSLPGNQAYHDQILALKWVKNNIRHFGGDPSDVTLSGDSTGSMCTSVLSISPLAKGLFNKAILMSGTGFTFSTPPSTSNDLLHDLAAQAGCAGRNEEVEILCLKRQPAEKLHIDLTIPRFIASVSSGDDLLPRPVRDLITDRDYLSEVGFFSRDYVISLTKDDAYILLTSHQGKMDTTSIETIAYGVANVLSLPKSVSESLLREYIKLFDDLEKSTIALLTDLYVGQSISFLQIFEQGASVSDRSSYLLSFDHAPQYIPKQYMVHGLDLAYLFDLNPNQLMKNFCDIEGIGDFLKEDFQLKSAFIDLITAFMKTRNGKENIKTKNNMLWPPFSTETRNYLSFSLHPLVKQDLFGKRQTIWEELLPELLKQHKLREMKQDL